MASDPSLSLVRPYAELDWAEGGPRARTADDVYFSAEDGLAETRAVFLRGAGFPERFLGQTVTVVGELGFGTGLNFLALWALFRATAPAAARLHFVSVEGYPIRLADAAKALAAFPELADLADALISEWPAPLTGPHRRVFDDGRVTLTVFQDEAEAALSQMAFHADAWFLDGFAPAKNPEMWTHTLFDQLARLSKPGAPAATFTVAGRVRRGLAAAGFDVAKKPGFGLKRERLEAVYAGSVAQPEPTPFPAPQPVDGPIAVIGGGIAAASLVEAFGRRGRAVDVFAEAGWAAGASGGPAGLLTPRLEAADRPHNRALLAAFDYARRLYDGRPGLASTGVLRTAVDTAARARLQRLADALDDGFVWCEDTAARTDIAGAPGGLWMARAGQIIPSELVAALGGAASPRNEVVRAVLRSDAGWRVQGAGGHDLGDYAAVIIAGGWDSAQLLPSDLMPLGPTAGRVASFEAEGRINAPMAWGGYAAPLDDAILIGATHEKGASARTPAEAEPVLRESASELSDALAARLGPMRGSWGGVRSATPDRLPAVGSMPDSRFDEAWGAAARGGPIGSDRTRQQPNGLYALTGFGARGFAHAPLLAEALVSGLMKEPLPLERAGLEALHPARFRWRALRRS